VRIHFTNSVILMWVTVLFLRHKLQKGLCSKENPPTADEMPSMVDHLNALETFQDLEPSIIRETKAAKLLKVILRTDIPRDDEFKFKERCQKLLAGWTSILAGDDVKRDNTNGVTKEETKENTKDDAKDLPVLTNGDKKAEEEKKEEETTAAAESETKAEPEENAPAEPVTA